MTASDAIWGGAGAILLAVVAYFLRTRDARLTSVEKQSEGSCKDVAVITGQLDTISKRLSAGAESFKDITNTQKQMQENQTYILTNFVKTTAFEKEQDKTSAKFETVDRNLNEIKDTVTEVKLSIKGIENKLEGGIKTMTDLLAKVVTIPNDPKDRA